MTTLRSPEDDLLHRYQVLLREGPVRARQAAAALGVSELELVAAGCGCEQVVPLSSDFRALLPELTALGEVMALTRNAHCVHERQGVYQSVNTRGHAGLVLGPDIDLRVFFGHWHHGYAVRQQGRDSLQFFDADGVAVHKVYRLPDAAEGPWQAWVAQHAAAHPAWPVPTPVALVSRQATPNDPAALRAEWLAMQDTHDFFPLLQRHRVAREGALACVGPDLAQQVAPGAVERMLQAAVEQALNIMCFVGSRGVIQIHTGPVRYLRRTGPWFNVLDPRFNLHLNTEAVARSWVVNKPTADGWVTSLELYDAAGDLIVQWFGARKPGVPELPGWRAVLRDLCQHPLAEVRG